MSKGFRRELSFLDAFMISVGGMIGGAIFIFPGATGKLSGDASFISWLMAGLLMMIIALLYIELSTIYPRTGGPAVYPYMIFIRHKGLADFLSYLEGAGFFIGWLIGIVVSALSLPSYLNYIIPGAGAYMVPIAVISILLAFIVNFLGIKFTGKTNMVLTSILLALLMVFVGEALVHGSPPIVARKPVFFLNGLPPAVALAIGAYGAWVGLTAIAEEIKDPLKNIPRSVISSLLFVSLVYGLVVYALESLVQPQEFLSVKELLYSPLGFASLRTGSILLGRYLLPMGAITAIFTTMLVGMMSVSRVLYAMGENLVLPSILSKVYAKTGVPAVGLAITTVASIILSLYPSFFFKFIVVGLVIGTDIPYAINILAFIYNRYSWKEKISYHNDVFMAPAGIVLAISAFLILSFVTVSLGIQEPLWTLGVLAAVFVFYLALKLTKHNE